MKSEMEQDLFKVLVTEEQLKRRIAELGGALYERFAGKNPLFLGVLKGSFVFMADLVRACQLKSDVEFIAVSSYENATVSSGRVHINHDIQQDISGRHLIIVEDILELRQHPGLPEGLFSDQGRRLHHHRDAARQARPAAPRRSTRTLWAYGAGRVRDGLRPGLCPGYRNLPYIGVLKPEVYAGQ